MATYPLDKSVTDVQACIQYSLDKKMFMPTVILIYSAIDGAAWLSHAKGENVRDDFINWVDKWMIQQGKMKCTAKELYAARCAILHSFTSQTKLTRDGNARQICYAFESGTPEEMQSAIDSSERHRYVSIHLNDLYESYLVGYVNFKSDIFSDVSKKVIFEKKLNTYFVQKDGKEANDFVGR